MTSHTSDISYLFVFYTFGQFSTIQILLAVLYNTFYTFKKFRITMNFIVNRSNV